MDALLLRSLQDYVRDTFGPAVWQAACRHAGLKVETFEPMLRYDPGMADEVAAHAAIVLRRPVDAIWDDMGTHLVTSPGRNGVRRLLRFGGISFADFLHSLEEMPGRARLAMPDLELPEVSLTETEPNRFELRCRSHLRGTLRVLVGVLTAIADDYGTLCVIEAEEADLIVIRILDSSHAKARRFDLAMPGV
jgi:hypothetical protein